ncbi:hypothetical protein [Streptomyces spongiae]|uniref:Uncharacterized protein n=1 Tax=Streptomyces spongiae TaxID=565072 RepID=A0A5N8X8C7_9ACTN|nr:hypothetical protein [Streptomyces spongiae]MPY55730.1 hypothetical protein [Streptomyces spongiae]
MRSPDYTRLAAQLPAVYQQDPVSFAQVDAYLGLADDLNRAIVERLEDLLLGLGPDAVLRWPADVPLDAGPDALLRSYLATYDEVAAWAGFVFPASWPRTEAGLARRRQFLARSARLWRRRGTPRGFLSWFALYFGIVRADERPYLLEHYKAPGTVAAPAPYSATLFVPAPRFADWARREEAADFVHRYAPAHVGMRVCFVNPELLTRPPLTDPPVLPDSPTPSQLDAYAAAVAEHEAKLNALLCSAVSEIDHRNGIHIHACVDGGRPHDRLDVGRLPTT